MDRKQKMDALFKWSINEWFNNLDLAIASTLVFQILFYRRNFFAVQGTAMGFATGISIYHAQ